MKAASSRCENCSSLIACCSCGVIANVWREARMRLGPIRMRPHPEVIRPPAGALSKKHARAQRPCDRHCLSVSTVRSVLENIGIGPTGQVEAGAAGQEAEGRLGKLGPPFARQQRV